MYFKREDSQEEGKKRQKQKEKKENATFSRALITLAWENSKPTDCWLTPLFFFPDGAVLLVCPSRSLLTCQFDKESRVVVYLPRSVSSRGLAGVSSS